MIRIEKFDNINRWLEAAQGPQLGQCSRRSRTDATNNSHDAKWLGSTTFEEAITRATKGWPEGTAKANDYLLQLTPFLRTIRGYRQQWCPGVLPGGSLIIDRYAKGLPDMMMNRQKKPSNKFARIVINGSMYMDAEENEFLKRGSLIMALIQTLERNNYRCQIVAQNCTIGGDRTLVTEAILKDYNQSLDMDRLAFWACSLSVNRRISFSYRETLTQDWIAALGIGSGYGQSSDFPPNDNSIYFPSIRSVRQKFNTIESMITYLKELLNKVGVGVL